MRKQAHTKFFASKQKNCFCFASFRFKAKMTAVFASFSFSFASFQFSTFCIDAKQAKKALFCNEAKKLHFRFASKQNNGAT
jgi:hypothetical protein